MQPRPDRAAAPPTVYLIEEPSASRDRLRDLLASVGLSVETHITAQEFLDGRHADDPGCLVSELRLRGMSGLELLERRTEFGLHLPIILCTAHGSIRLGVRAMKVGAFSFLERPPDDQELLDTVQQAIRRDADDRKARQQAQAVSERFAHLTPREREILHLIAEGIHNKVICTRLAISRKTLGVHRTNLSKKLQVRSLAELLRLVYKSGFVPPDEVVGDA